MTTRVLPAASGCGGKRRRNKTLDGGGVTGRNSAGSYVIERAVQGRAEQGRRAQGGREDCITGFCCVWIAWEEVLLYASLCVCVL